MLPARQGDAVWIEYGEDPRHPYRVLIDCGVHATYKTLAERIRALPEEQRRFELVVVTHIDGDHIHGAVPLLADSTLQAQFAYAWFNGRRHLPGTVESMGPIQGEELTNVLQEHVWNAAFDGGAAAVPSKGPLPRIDLSGGLALTIIAPATQQLERLQTVWAEAVRGAGLEPGRGKPPTPLDGSVLEPMGAPAVPNVHRLADSPFIEDAAVANGASIVLLAEYGDAAALLCGDAWPSVIRWGIERLLLQRGSKELGLSAFKLPHHGSRYNIDRKLLELLDCREFLFSSDGTGTAHPHLEAVARVLQAHRGSRLWFNYKTRFNEVWGRDVVLRRYGHKVVYGDGELAIDLEPVDSSLNDAADF
jgi:hypothetical protein